MKRLLMCIIGTAMLSGVAVAEICTDFDDNFNIIEYECGTSAKNAKVVDESKFDGSEKRTNKKAARQKARGGKNVMDDNPLYMPERGDAYSLTLVGYSRTNTVQDLDTEYKMSVYGVAQEFGFGISDNLTIFGGFTGNVDRTKRVEQLYAGVYEDEYKETRARISLGGIYRLFNAKSWKLDVFGQYNADDVYYKYTEDGDKVSGRFDRDFTNYTWGLGIRGGYTASRFTVAAHTRFSYTNSESFNWFASLGQQGIHDVNFGLDGQLVLNRHVNFVAGIDYNKSLDTKYRGLSYVKLENPDVWIGRLGVNFNVDENTFVGLYVVDYLNTPFKYKVTTNDWYGSDESVTKYKQSFETGIKLGISF